MEKPPIVGLFFGGSSPEHEISLLSAENLSIELRKAFDVRLFYLDKNNQLFSVSENFFKGRSLGEKISILYNGHVFINQKVEPALKFDIAFPAIHGNYGEDGSIQGFFHTLGIPYVGSDIESSVLCFDKHMTKLVLGYSQIPIGKYMVCNKEEPLRFDEISSSLGTPFIVKPARSGSSFGVGKVISADNFSHLVEEAFKFDSKIIFEEYVGGRELSCAVVESGDMTMSGVGEDIPGGDFNSYEIKYFSEKSRLVIPAEINRETEQKIREYAQRVFKIMRCAGLARVDFFLKGDGTILFNEINTMPGFTSHSLFPLLMQAAGLPYDKLFEMFFTSAQRKHAGNVSFEKPTI